MPHLCTVETGQRPPGSHSCRTMHIGAIIYTLLAFIKHVCLALAELPCGAIGKLLVLMSDSVLDLCALDKHSLDNVLRHLGPGDLARSAVCRALQGVGCGDRLWARHLEEEFDLVFQVRGIPPHAIHADHATSRFLRPPGRRSCMPRMPGLAPTMCAVRMQGHAGVDLQAIFTKLMSGPASFPLRYVGVYTDGGMDNM